MIRNLPAYVVAMASLAASAALAALGPFVASVPLVASAALAASVALVVLGKIGALVRIVQLDGSHHMKELRKSNQDMNIKASKSE